MSKKDHYDLYYWPKIPGRGEFIRLALEWAAADYTDHCNEAGNVDDLMPLIDNSFQGHGSNPPPFAPPILKHDDIWLSQTPNILMYLGPRLGLAPETGAVRYHINALQLTISDLSNEVHDVHHPIAVSLYYEDQKAESLRRAKDLRDHRIPKFFKYFERTIKGDWLTGADISYADLSLFQVIEGLRFAFPRLMKQIEAEYPGIMSIHERLVESSQLKDYLRKRLPFSEGLFRHYDELDVPK